MAELAVGIQGIVFDDDGAQPQRRMERDDVLRAVRQDQRHPVAGPDAEFLHARGHPADGGPEFAVAGACPEELQRRFPSVTPDGGVHEVGQGPGGEFEVDGNTGAVVAGPGRSGCSGPADRLLMVCPRHWAAPGCRPSGPAGPDTKSYRAVPVREYRTGRIGPHWATAAAPRAVR